jgi:hypothetical protein
MDHEALGRWMVRRGALDAGGLLRARKRQSLYGGALDTALLELGLCDERTVVTQLAEASGLLAGDRDWLESAAKEIALSIDRPTARRLGAQPIALQGDTLQLAVRFGADLKAAADWAASQDRGAFFRIVPEVRLEALWAKLHAVSAPTRFAHLLGKLMGAEKAHRTTRISAPAMARPLVETGPTPERRSRPRPLAPAPVPVPAPAPVKSIDSPPPIDRAEPPIVRRPVPVAAAPELPPPPAVDITDDLADLDDLEESVEELLPLLEATAPGSAQRLALLRRLRPFAEDHRLSDRVGLWRQRVAEGDDEAARALGAIADRQSVPVLLELVASDEEVVRDAALVGLRAITLHDFGRARWRWARWWREFAGKHRVEWLLDALSAQEPALRLEAARELEQLSGRYVGYHFDLGKRDRDEARRRWEDWWQTTGRAGVQDQEARARRPLS